MKMTYRQNSVIESRICCKPLESIGDHCREYLDVRKEGQEFCTEKVDIRRLVATGIDSRRFSVSKELEDGSRQLFDWDHL